MGMPGSWPRAHFCGTGFFPGDSSAFFETSSSEIRGRCLLIHSIHLWSRTRILKPLSERVGIESPGTPAGFPTQRSSSILRTVMEILLRDHCAHTLQPTSLQLITLHFAFR